MARRSGRGLMVAGAIVAIVGLGNVLVKTVEIPGYWMPFIVGIALLVAGVIIRMTSEDRG
ncbi:MAG: hypothetical protein ACRELS_20480 [Candidatus Rokuibacteriota bacterium]